MRKHGRRARELRHLATMAIAYGMSAASRKRRAEEMLYEMIRDEIVTGKIIFPKEHRIAQEIMRRGR